MNAYPDVSHSFRRIASIGAAIMIGATTRLAFGVAKMIPSKVQTSSRACNQQCPRTSAKDGTLLEGVQRLLYHAEIGW